MAAAEPGVLLRRAEGAGEADFKEQINHCRAGEPWWDRGQGSLVFAVPRAGSPCWFPWALEALESSDPGELLALHHLSRPNSISEPPGILLQLHPSGCAAPETELWLLLVRKDILSMGRGWRGWARAAGGFPVPFPALSEEVGAGGQT